MYHSFPQKIYILNITSVFNIDNNNETCLLSSKSVYYNDFWRSCDTEDWSNTALIIGINFILKYIQIHNRFEIQMIFHNICTVFLIK